MSQMSILRKILSISFALFILLQSFSKIWIVISFKIHQKYIAENFCVNRNMPAPIMCSGKCYLNEQLKKETEETPSQFPTAQFSKTEVVHYQDFFLPAFSDLAFDTQQNSLFPCYKDFPSQLLVRKFFHPPQV